MLQIPFQPSACDSQLTQSPIPTQEVIGQYSPTQPLSLYELLLSLIVSFPYQRMHTAEENISRFTKRQASTTVGVGISNIFYYL
jgi:hypothetical protein